MPNKVGDKTRVSCLNFNCNGMMNGTYGGNFYQGEAEYMQHLNCKCEVCSLEKPEVFEVFSDRHDYDVVDSISVMDDELGCSYRWQGFGMPLAEIEDPEALLNTAVANMRQLVRNAPTNDEWGEPLF